jgi:hypothetical protein
VIRRLLLPVAVGVCLLTAPTATLATELTIGAESCYEGGPNGLIVVSGLAEGQEARVGEDGSPDYAVIPAFGGGLSVAPGTYAVEVYEDGALIHDEVVDVLACGTPSARPAAPTPTLPPTDTAPSALRADDTLSLLFIVVFAVGLGIGALIAGRHER